MKINGTAPTPFSNFVDTDEEMLTPAEVASIFRVDVRTVTRWAKAGKIRSIRTLGGHRRYYASEVTGLLTGSLTERTVQR